MELTERNLKKSAGKGLDGLPPHFSSDHRGGNQMQYRHKNNKKLFKGAGIE